MPRAPRPIATSDSPIAMITISDVPLDEVRRLHPPAAQVDPERAEQADRDRCDPERVAQRAVDDAADEDQQRAAEHPGGDADDRGEQIRVATRPEGVQRGVHDVHDQERDPEQHAVRPNAPGTASAARNIAPIATSTAANDPDAGIERRSSARRTTPTPTRSR